MIWTVVWKLVSQSLDSVHPWIKSLNLHSEAHVVNTTTARCIYQVFLMKELCPKILHIINSPGVETVVWGTKRAKD